MKIAQAVKPLLPYLEPESVPEWDEINQQLRFSAGYEPVKGND